MTAAPDVAAVLPRARRMARKMPIPRNGAMDGDDMEQDATVGVLDSQRTFDRERRTSFKAYAQLRARGAVIDGQRAMDHVPRSWRRAQRGVVRARTALVAELGRLPTPEELARWLGISAQEVRDIDGRCRIPTNLSEPLRGQQSSSEVLTVADLVTDNEPLPEETAEARDEARRLHAAISLLPGREEFTIRATWFMDMTLAEVAERLGVSPSRVSQMRTKAMERLPELLEKIGTTRAARAA